MSIQLIPNKNLFAIIAESEAALQKGEALSKRLGGISLNPKDISKYDFILSFDQRNRLQLSLKDKKQKPIQADFSKMQMGRASLSNALITKAIGIRKNKKPFILDACAGLGKDALTFLMLSCHVTLLERSPIVFELLKDGLENSLSGYHFSDLLSLHLMEAKDYLEQLKPAQYPDVIYLDPMYPDRNKKALSKKEMQILRLITGDNWDAADLLDKALSLARERVVVKRRRLDEPLGDKNPDTQLTGKTIRFDIYKTLKI
jgi:16S rRNA (guanine1516-N2)-methyltransferase